MKRYVTALVAAAVVCAVGASGQNNYPQVALRVTIQSSDSANRPCAICSDGRGEYVDGEEGVGAWFDRAGILYVVFQRTKTTYPRLVAFEYGTPYRVGSAPGPISGLQARVSLATLPADRETYIPPQALAVNQSQCLNMSWSYFWNDPETQWVHAFQRRTVAADWPSTSFIVVRRVADLNGARQWEVEPSSQGECNGATHVDTLASVISAPKAKTIVYTDRGLFYLPFKLTLVAK